MKRNKNLIELSRDHHHGLLLGWKIKQGIKNLVAIEELVNYVIHFCTKALFPHFKEEEDHVLIYLDAGNNFHKRTLAEHLEIQDLVKNISTSGMANYEMLLSLASMVEAHIRFEERELFPYIESQLSMEELDEMGKLISDLHQPYLETYENAFWTR